MTPVKEHKPFVPETADMPEFTLRAMVIGLVMCVILGAANAYLGLRAGQTIAATYPAAVIGMAILRVFKGSLLEEYIARTAGLYRRIGVAAGAIFTIPAFVLSGAWKNFRRAPDAYWKSTALMVTGSAVIGVLFVSLVRRFLVEDPDLPFPESVAAAHIHKAGQMGAQTASVLFYNIAYGGVVFLAGAFGVFATDINVPIVLASGVSGRLKLGASHTIATGGATIAFGAVGEPRTDRCGICDRTEAGIAQLFRQRARLGCAGPDDDLLDRTRPLFAPQMAGPGGWNWEDMATRVWRATSYGRSPSAG